MTSNPAATIQMLACSNDVIFSVTSALASCISFCARSPKSASRPVKACARAEFCSRSRAIGLPRILAVPLATRGYCRPLCSPSLELAFKNAEQQEASERSQAEHQRRLLAAEIRCGAPDILDRLVAHVARKPLHALGRSAHQAGELRRVLLELVGGAAHGVGDMAGEIGPGGDLRIEESPWRLGSPPPPSTMRSASPDCRPAVRRR